MMEPMGPGVRLAVAALALAAAIVSTAPAGGAPAAADGSARLDSGLRRVASLAAADPAGALQAAQEGGFATAGSRVRVVVETGDAAAESAVRAAGGTVQGRSGGLVSALVPPDALQGLAAAAGVLRVRAPYAAVPAVVSEGVAKLNAPAWHTAAPPGFTGAGVKVAVIDLGFAGLQQATAAGELPAGVEVVNRCGDRLASTNHGTGVAEIVRDVAPGAELTLICVFDEVGLAQAVADAKARGIRVIVHSVLWLNTSRGDGTGAPGTPDALAAAARAEGILWVNAAGNWAQKHWSGPFSDANADGVHEFAGSDSTNGVSPASSGEVCAYLKWDEWPVAEDDFDLELVLSDGTVFASSRNRQNGDDPPTEAVCTTGGGNALAVRVRRFAGSGTPRLDLFWIAPGTLEHRVAAGSLAEPATSPAVLAVGAICSQTQALQAYSSRGPTIGGVTKPDLVSYDAVSNFTFGGSTACTPPGAGFVGTSAAAPHVGGAAALVLQERPDLTPAQLQAVLEGKSVDLPPAGVDSDSGRGRLFLSVDLPAPTVAPAAAVEQTSATLAATIDPPVARTTYRFDYGPTTAYGSTTPTVQATGASATAPVSGLLPETVYHYRIVATNPFGSGQSADGTFTTLAYRPPTAATGAAAGIGSTGASLTATVNPNGKATTVAFELGSSTAYGTRTATVALPAGNAAVAVAVPASGLAPSTTYHFRVVAENELGQAVGADQVLTTTAPPAAAGGGGAAPDLELTATADRTAARVGETVLVRARVRLKNAGVASSASDVVLTAVLPQTAEFVSSRASRGPGCGGVRPVVCPLSFVSGTAGGEVELGVRLLREGPSTVAMSVRALERDPDAGNDAASVTITAAGTGAGAAPAGTARDRPPRLVLRGPTTATPQRALVRGRLARVQTELSVDEPVRLRLRVLDARSGSAVLLAAGSRLGPAKLRARAFALRSPLTRAGRVRATALVERAALVRGRRYVLELVAVDRGGRAARLRVRFAV